MNEAKPSRRTFTTGAAWWGGALTMQAMPQWSWGQETQAVKTQSVNARPVARGGRHAVATVHPLASQAAKTAFERGGNAVDAAVAASLMLSVVDGFNSGIGGGGLLLLRRASGEVVAIDGREEAPAAAVPEVFVTNGQPNPELSQTGPLAVGVPGLLAALHEASSRFGRSGWEVALAGAADVAEALRRFESSADVLLDGAGLPWRAGQVLRQADLAWTLRSIAAEGVDWFYRGEFAERIAAYMRHSGGLITVEDMANYRVKLRTPIGSTYRSWKVWGFPPPSSGGIHVAQMLGMLSGFDVAGIFARSEASGLHLLLEVMKRAMADRVHWLGDADFAAVPRGLLDGEYLRDRAADIDLGQATEVSAHGQPPRADLDLFGRDRHTTHLTTADAEGNVVSLTQTVNTSFGSKVIAPGTGVILNNEMDDFSLAPGVRNAFGLLGSSANAVAPGKRPLSSMSPTLVLNEAGELVCTCGAAGGPKIITSVLQTLVRVLDLQQSMDEALAAPRVHHQWSPDQAVCESGFGLDVLSELGRLGHNVRPIASAAVAQGIQWADGGQLLAAADPRVSGSAEAG
jgi:gamma-glutamyltranspeptidase / glutathione hydrolase